MKTKEEILNKYWATNMSVKKAAIISMQEYANQETAKLKAEIEELNKTIREIANINH